MLDGIFDKARYDSFRVRMEPYIGVCARSHPFAGREVLLDELFRERLILREEGSGTRNILERELAQQGYGPSAFADFAVVSSFKLITELTAEGFGVSFLYAAVVGDDPRFGRFSCPPLTGAHELNAVFLKHTDAGALARRFLGQMEG